MESPFRVLRLQAVPEEMDRVIDEVAARLGALYGPEAARDYRLRAGPAMKSNIANPGVYALAAFNGRLLAGLMLSVVRGTVAEVPFMHVIGDYRGQGVEPVLIDAAVQLYQAGGMEGILCECLPLSVMDLRGPFEAHGFRRIPREIMTASLMEQGLAAGPDRVCPPLYADDWDGAARTLVAAYEGDPGRLLHLEVGSVPHALDFIGRVVGGSFGRPSVGACRVAGDRASQGVILGCSVAPGVGFVLQVAVRPEHRGEGVATALLRAQAAAYREAGLRRVSLGVTTSNPARRLYARLGFTRLIPVEAFVWWRPGYAPV